MGVSFLNFAAIYVLTRLELCRSRYNSYKQNTSSCTAGSCCKIDFRFVVQTSAPVDLKAVNRHGIACCKGHHSAQVLLKPVQDNWKLDNCVTPPTNVGIQRTRLDFGSMV